jgi:tetratricopeptide (TPR) repeat protein
MTSSRLGQLRKLLDLDPSDPFVLYGIAQELAKAGDVPGALEFYDRCLAADPRYCYAYYHKARVLEDSGDVAGAVEAARAGLGVARSVQDMKAVSELQGLLDVLE